MSDRLSDHRRRKAEQRRDAGLDAAIAGMHQVMTDPEPEQWHYASFVDNDRPEGDRFIGAIYVRGETLEAALTRSHLLGINPGGEAQFVGPIPTGVLDENGVAAEDRERLLTREEVEGTT